MYFYRFISCEACNGTRTVRVQLNGGMGTFRRMERHVKDPCFTVLPAMNWPPQAQVVRQDL